MADPKSLDVFKKNYPSLVPHVEQKIRDIRAFLGTAPTSRHLYDYFRGHFSQQKPEHPQLLTYLLVHIQRYFPDFKPKKAANFAEFQSRLALQLSKPLGPKLGKLLTEDDRQKIISYFLPSGSESSTLQWDLDRVSRLMRGCAHRLDKHATNLPRTLHILCDETGDFWLIIETKSKQADGSKEIILYSDGSKPNNISAWRIDKGEEEYVNVTISLPATRRERDFQMSEAQKATDISLSAQSERILPSYLGAPFVKYKKDTAYSVSQYSVMAECKDLPTFLKKQAHLDAQIREGFIREILQGVKVLHDRGIIHQDLKLGNLVVFGNETDGFHLKIIDLRAADFSEATRLVAIASYSAASPEIFYTHQTAIGYYYNFYHRNTDYSIGGDAFHNRGWPRLSRDAYLKPHKANDMWALGCICFRLRYQAEPSLQQVEELAKIDPLIEGLFRHERESRFTIDQAIEAHNTQFRENT